jgi:hypothetical protein
MNFWSERFKNFHLTCWCIIVMSNTHSLKTKITIHFHEIINQQKILWINWNLYLTNKNIKVKFYILVHGLKFQMPFKSLSGHKKRWNFSDSRVVSLSFWYECLFPIYRLNMGTFNIFGSLNVGICNIFGKPKWF